MTNTPGTPVVNDKKEQARPTPSNKLTSKVLSAYSQEIRIAWNIGIDAKAIAKKFGIKEKAVLYFACEQKLQRRNKIKFRDFPAPKIFSEEWKKWRKSQDVIGTMRDCLGCREPFTSVDNLFVCDTCKDTELWRSSTG